MGLQVALVLDTKLVLRGLRLETVLGDDSL